MLGLAGRARGTLCGWPAASPALPAWLAEAAVQFQACVLAPGLLSEGGRDLILTAPAHTFTARRTLKMAVRLCTLGLWPSALLRTLAK